MNEQSTSPHIQKLSPIEERILEVVVTRWIENSEPTKGREIRFKIRDSRTGETLERLVPDFLRKSGDKPQEIYRPTMLGCAHTRWAPGFSLAAERMLEFFRVRALHEPGFEYYDSDEVFESAHLDRRGFPTIRAAILTCGFSSSGSHSENEFRFAVPRDLEAIVALNDVSDLLSYRIKVERERAAEPTRDRMLEKIDSKKVFVVHGHRDAAKHEVARFIESKAGLTAVILDEQPNRGQSILEKLESNGDVGFAVVLFTGDDEGRVAPVSGESTELQPRARQNVVLELGYFTGRLGRDKVCVLYESGVEMPSDYHGIGYIGLDAAGAWKQGLVKELLDAGIDVDPSWYS